MSRSSSRDIDVPLLRTSDARSRSRPGSRPSSRPGFARHTTSNSVSTIPPGPEDLINPGASISEEDAELLQDLVHPHHHHHHDYHAVEETLVEETESVSDADKVDPEWKQKLSWWRRPSPWWFLSYVPFAAIAMTISAAAKIELFTYLVCQTHKPVYNPDQGGDLVLTVASHAWSALQEPSQRLCAQDPVVQAVIAKLTTAMTTTTGILTCMTTAWWGSLSDRFGRTRVLGCAVVGVLIMDFSFLATFWFYEYIPGGYWFLLIGPMVEGFLGGQALISATIHAYISDCTPPALRSGIFSLYLGLLFTGVGIGPTLGGLVIRFTGKFILVFYISTIIHAAYALLVWFVIPESLSKAEMLEARTRHKFADAEYRASHARGGVRVFFKRMFGFLTPLSLFLPIYLDGNPMKGRKKDWNLLFVVLAYGFTISLMGLYLYIIQYLIGSYGWNTEQVGYWFSSLGVARAVFLTLILPAIIKLAKRRSTAIQLPQERDEPLIRSPSPTQSGPTEDQSLKHSSHHSAHFDLVLARASLVIDAVVYMLMVCSTNAITFAAVTALGAFAMGFGPAIQSVALTLYNRRGGKDSGKLFGAMSVVQAMSSQVFGPFVYGLTYAKTVGTYPKTIFVMGVGAILTSLFLLLLVRLPKDMHFILDVEEQPLPDATAPRLEREDTLVGVSEPLIVVDDEDRGRKVLKP